jgi:hypothetical protein
LLSSCRVIKGCFQVDLVMGWEITSIDSSYNVDVVKLNERNAGESTQALKSTTELILKHYIDTQQLTKPNANPNIVESKWRRPPLEYLKNNVDRSYVANWC